MALEPYQYTSEPIVEFKIEPFIVDPPSCNVLYECISPDGFCDLQSVDGENYGTFEQAAGVFKLRVTDPTLVAPGEYRLVFRGTVGTKSDEFELILSFVDICPDVTITLLEDGVFTDSTYLIRSEE